MNEIADRIEKLRRKIGAGVGNYLYLFHRVKISIF